MSSDYIVLVSLANIVYSSDYIGISYMTTLGITFAASFETADFLVSSPLVSPHDSEGS